MIERARVPPQELRRFEEALSRWQSPAEFILLTKQTIDKLGSVQFFNDGRLPFARDAWVAARIASATTADKVRLCPDQWPDYEERSAATGTVQYEITEADLPGRHRGSEYRKAEQEGFPLEHDPVENWVARANQAPQALSEAARLKAGRGYPPTSRLVIYLNIG